MRDTVFGILLVVGLYVGWNFMKPQPSNFSNQNQGVTNEKPNHASSGQARHHGKSQRSSEPSAEVEGLPSIYQDQEEQRLEHASVNSENSENPKPEYGAIKGVPIRAWVQNRPSLPAKDFTAYPTDEKMRLFVQCTEWKKKGVEYVGDNGCNKLIAQRESKTVDPVK